MSVPPLRSPPALAPARIACLVPRLRLPDSHAGALSPSARQCSDIEGSPWVASAQTAGSDVRNRRRSSLSMSVRFPYFLASSWPALIAS